MGFDNECILNIQSLAGEYFCPVCRLLVYPNEAFQSQCTHLYCKPCLKYIAGTTRACPYDGYLVTEADSKLLIESNKTLAATIGKIAVHCLYHRSGCTWQGPLSECTSHCSGCAFGNSPVVCNRCGIQIVHRQVQEHAQICPGVQPHLQQGQGVQDSAATGTTAAADQSQTASQSGTQTAQAQASQTTTGPLSGHDPNQQTNANTQVQSVAVAAVTTPEQCYQQQYQQYYQQYPGYDPYQQTYQHYYPHQQQAIQQYQQHPQHVQGQHQPQAQAQPHPQHQPQVQPQEHNYVQAQVAAQHQNQPQVNPQQQLHPAVQPQMQSQTHPPLPGHLHPQPYPQAQPQSIQPHPQQQVQMSQYQQPHSQMLHPQPQIQLQPHSQVHPQPHSVPQSQPLSQSQAPVQYHSHPHPHPHPQLHPSQPNQPPNPNVQTHTQHPLAPVTGPHSYPQPQALQQMQLGAPQHHPMHILPQSGPLPQQPAEMPSQFPQQPQMHPPQSHAPVPSQQQPAFLPSQGQVPSVPPAQQQLIHPHVLQPGHLVHQRPIMQPLQKPFPQQYLQQQQQQQQPFPGKTSVLVQNQLHQQLPMQSQLRPQVPPHSVQKNSHAYLQPQQNVAHGLQPHQSQNYVGRPMIPNHGGHSHPFPQSPSAAQVRPMQLAANQPSAEARTLKSGTGVKSMDDDTSQVGTLAKDTDCVSQTAENGSAEPAINPMMKDGTKHDLEPSPGGKSVEIVAEEQKDANDVPKQEDHFSVDDSSLQQAKSFKEHRGKLPKDAVVPVSTGTSKGSQALPVASAHIPDSSTPDVTPQGNSRTPLTGGDPSQHGYQERNLSQSQFTPQGPGVDEFRGFPPHGQVQGKGFGHPAPVADQGRHQQPLMQYLPSSHQQRPVAPSMLQPVPPPGPPHQAQVPRRPPILLRPQGLGNLPLAGQPLNPPEHIQPPVKQPYGSLHPEVLLSGIPGLGSTLSFGRGPSHLGPSQRSFELLSSASQGHYNQGHAPLSHAGLPRISQGEPPVGGVLVPQGAVPSVSSDLHSGIMGRAQLHSPEGQFGQHRPINPTETEIFSNQGSHHFDARKPDSHLPETSESGPFGPPPGFESNVMRMNGPPGLDSMSAPGLQDERSRPLSGDHFPMEPARHLDRGEFEDPKQFPRHSHLDTDPVPKFGSNFSTSTPIDRGACGFIVDVASRPLDKAPLGLNYDAGLKLEPGAGGVPSRFLPPYLPAGTLHPNDAGEKTYMAGLDDNVGRADISRTHPDFRDAIARFGQHPRSPGGEKLGVPTRGVGGLSGVPRNQSGLDDVDGRESHPFGEGPISFSLPSDPVGNSFHESRLPALPSHLRRGELDGQDILPRHLWRGELLDPGHLRLGARAGFGAFPGHARIGELAGPGNFPHHLPLGESFGGKLSHPQLGEPGFRSSCALQGFPTDSGFYKGGLDSFERKGKTVSMGWCRICKVDCETVEALDLHSQTREHQKMTMDMVLSIKQHNAKKHKTSKDHALLEEASKSRITGHEGRGNKP